MADNNYKQVVVLSGKGGTGKTTIASGLTEVIRNKVIIDADVDAANMHLVLKYKITGSTDYCGAKKAIIDISLCSQCGLCESVCRFDAIRDFKVIQHKCESCGFCFRICPDNAIKFEEVKTGMYTTGELEDGSKFYYAKLLPGEGNSGKLVSELKKTAMAELTPEIKWMIVDGPPGIGCPVNASLTGADFAILVTEPTQTGWHDLMRIIELLRIFKIKSGVIINKYTINKELTNKITEYIMSYQISLLGKIPFDDNYVKAIQNSQTIVKYNSDYESIFRELWKNIETLVTN
ncbi:MAG: ATP-binding protein [Ignavibacteriaceae bacterium]